jgi:glycosyltransferase involved in cell wall biosynthesis
MTRLTLSMIVKNEEKYLRECLESVRGVIDEIVLVDTGSTDLTIEIAEEFNANIFHFDWIDDFSAARNFALSKSTGDWILYLDADERLDKNSLDELKRKTSDTRKAGFYCTVKSTDSNDSHDNSIRYIRLFANRPEISFTGKVHEQIEESLNSNGYYITNSGIAIHHVGYNVSKEEKQQKAKRNLNLLLSEYESIKTPYCAFQLAQTYNVLDDKENARKYFQIAADSPKLERLYKALCYSALAYIAHTMNKVNDAEKLVIQSLKLNDCQPYAHFLASKIYLRIGNAQKAEVHCKKAYDLNQKMKNSIEGARINILLNDEEVLYFGLLISNYDRNSVISKYFQNEIISFYKSIKINSVEQFIGLLQKIFKGTVLSETELALLEGGINKNNLDYLLQLSNIFLAKNLKVTFLKKLCVRYASNNEVKKSLSKGYEEEGRIDEAINVLESDPEMLTGDAAMMFYLLSYYLKKGDKNKVALIIEQLEKNFNEIPDIFERVKVLKTRLASFLSHS